MKKNGILNSNISRVLSDMGHTDTLCVGDCGLPIPQETERIDLALRFGQPSFMDSLSGNPVILQTEFSLCDRTKKDLPQRENSLLFCALTPEKQSSIMTNNNNIQVFMQRTGKCYVNDQRSSTACGCFARHRFPGYERDGAGG